MKSIYNQPTVFVCERCHKQFIIADYQSVEKAKCQCLKHQSRCYKAIDVFIGDVVIFNDFQNVTHLVDSNNYQTPPMFVTNITSDGNYQCMFTLFDYYNNSWAADRIKTSQWFYNCKQKSFIFTKDQINRKLNCKDYIKQYRYLDKIKQHIQFKDQYNDRQINSKLISDFDCNKVILMVEVPVKYQG